MKRFRLLLLFLTCIFALSTAHAQIAVRLSLKEHFYIVHEPLIATVNLTNNTGRDITLQDTEQFRWFAFRIKTAEDRMILPRNAKYHLEPLVVRAGETVRRTVNLNELYELGDFGIYSVRAEIYFDAIDKFFDSPPASIELTEGRLLWKRVAGVPPGLPNGGQMHAFSLLAHQRGEGNLLFVRVEDQEDRSVFCTTALGRILVGTTPEMEFDAANNLYVLQLVAQKAYILSKISPNGEFLGQTNYSAEKSRPTLRKLANGTLQLIGGRREDRLAQGPPATAPSKLSERPPGLPVAPSGN